MGNERELKVSEVNPRLLSEWVLWQQAMLISPVSLEPSESYQSHDHT